METATAPKSGFEKWQDGINKAVDNPQWNSYDCEIMAAVNELNQHLSGKSGYQQLDWRVIKAMVWTETGAAHAEWKTKPMQIGVPGDPGLTALLSGKEGGELILPAQWKSQLTAGTASTLPSHNLRAGIGYLLMRMANFEHKSISASDPATYEVTVKPGDSLDKLAKLNGTTVDMLKQTNPTAVVLRPGQVLKYRKASIQRVISGWRTVTSNSIAQRYNGGGDPRYANKIDYALGLVLRGKDAVCEP